MTISDEPATTRDTRLIWAGLFFAIAVFSKFPGLDLLFSMRYYSAEGGFVHRQDLLVLALYNWTPWIGRALVLVLALYALSAPLIARLMAARGRQDLATRALGPWRRLATLTVCCVLLGNGLVIEGVFKNFMGRPRPVQVDLFGGTQAYHGPFVPGNDPTHHRSFVSSHAAAGFALMGLGLGCGPIWRRRWFLIGALSGAIIGMGRILQGGHFLSDIIFSFYAVWLSCELVAWLDSRRRTKARAPHTASTRTP